MSARYVLTFLTLASVAVPARAQWTSRLSRSAQGAQLSKATGAYDMSADGRFVPLITRDALATPSLTTLQQVVLLDRQDGSLEAVSVDAQGSLANGHCVWALCSDDGRYVVFTSEATNLVPGLTTSAQRIYRRDRVAGTTELLVTKLDGTPSSATVYLTSVSADGQRIVFTSYDDELVLGDTGFPDVFLLDMTAGTLVRVAQGMGGAEPDDVSGQGQLTPDGTRVVFSSRATNLVPQTLGTPHLNQVFLWDVASGTTTLVSQNGAGVLADDHSYGAYVAADGDVVAFSSDATNLDGLDTNGKADVYVRTLSAGTTVRVSWTWDGKEPTGAGILAKAISADGRYVVMDGQSNDMVPEDTNGYTDSYLVDLLSGDLTLLSASTGGQAGNQGAWPYAVTADGSAVLMYSFSDDLVPGDTNGVGDTFLRILNGCGATSATYCTPSLTSIPGCQSSVSAQGASSLSAPQGFQLRSGAVPGGPNLGIGYFGVSGPAAIPLGTLGGVVCAAAPKRTSVAVSGGTVGLCDGEFVYDLADLLAAAPGLIEVGSTVHFGLWFRDPPNPDSIALSNAIWFEVCP